MKKTKSETDWERVLAFKEGDPIPCDPEDGPYDPNDAKATRTWFAQADLIRNGKVVRKGKRGPQKAPTKKQVSLRLLPEVIDHFKAAGPGWQTRIDGALLEAIKKGSVSGSSSIFAFAVDFRAPSFPLFLRKGWDANKIQALHHFRKCS